METQRYDILIENIKNLPLEEKQELKSLLEKYIIDERRQDIYIHYQESMKNLRNGELKFSSDINRLKQIIREE